MKTCRHFINGEYTDGDAFSDIVNPVTGEIIGSAERGTQVEMYAAVENAYELEDLFKAMT
jgi:acyl-CoA reductase-like NAD-dependent aldehyde dehydrogenase